MRKFALSLAFLSLLRPELSRAERGPLTADEKSVLESSPGVVLVIVSYKITVTIQGRRLDPSIATFNPTSTGSGFLYRPDGYLVTNAHVVEDANLKDQQAQEARKKHLLHDLLLELDQRLKSSGHRGLTAEDLQGLNMVSTTPQIEVYLANKEHHTGEIKIYSDPTGRNVGKDVAILKIDANNLPTVKLGNSDEVRSGDPLRVIGYPGAVSPLVFDMISPDSVLVPTFTSGHVSAIKKDYKGTLVIQSDAAITHGNSGGPAFSGDGEVVGIATYATGREVAGFNFFVPINTAMEFVRQAGATPESGAFDKAWSSALDAYQAGNWDTAKGHLSDALTLMPDEPDALRLQSVASQKARAESPLTRMTEGVGTMVWAGAGAIFLVLVTMIGFIMMRSRRTPIPVNAGPVPPRTVLVHAEPSIIAPHKQLPATFGTLHITAGPLSGNQFQIPKAGILIGRDSTKCNVVLADDTVSKEHAWVVPVDSEVVVIDRGSSNGTYVNSTDSPGINKVTLKNGDRVFIGKKGAAVLTYFSG